MDDSIRRWLYDPSSIPSDFTVTQDWTREQIVISRAIIRARREGAEWQPTKIAAYAADDLATLPTPLLFAGVVAMTLRVPSWQQWCAGRPHRWICSPRPSARRWP